MTSVVFKSHGLIESGRKWLVNLLKLFLKEHAKKRALFNFLP